MHYIMLGTSMLMMQVFWLIHEMCGALERSLGIRQALIALRVLREYNGLFQTNRGTAKLPPAFMVVVRNPHAGLPGFCSETSGSTGMIIYRPAGMTGRNGVLRPF